MNTTYDFDIEFERRGSGALKYDALQERYGDPDLLPLWVADMDFATPPFIVDAIRKRLEHPIFGYTVNPPDYIPSIVDWLKYLHGVEVKPEWIRFVPGIVKGIGMVIDHFSQPGDKVIIMPPVYHPFRIVPEGNGRKVVWNPLKETPEGRYEIDFENLAEVVDEKCKILILSNPHNPAGIAWDLPTLQRLAKFCRDRGIIVISDEIHSEMMLYNKKHIPWYEVSADARACGITFAAPSKTFNIAGIVSSYAIVPDPILRDKLFSFLNANELDEPTLFSPIATIAAYRQGKEWRHQMLDYVTANIEFIISFCENHLPGIKALRPDASFLVWLDCGDLNLTHDQLISLFQDKARLALNDGEMFGPGGEGHMRLNAGAPRSVIERALLQLKKALENSKS